MAAPAGIDGGDEAVHKASRPKSSSQVTLCWRKVDSNPRSPCGGWRLGLLPRSYGKFRRANCGSHLTHRWREPDSNLESLSEIVPLAPGQMIGNSRGWCR